MNGDASTVTALRANWPALLMLGVLVLLPIGRSAEAPLVIAGAAGVVLAWRARRELAANTALRLALALFACIWLPALISAPDSIAPAKSWGTVAGFLRFAPFLAFACLALRNALWPRLVQACAAVVVLWLIDAWVQAFTGYSIAGAPEQDRLSGIFGAGNLKLGQMLAVLSPFVLIAARDALGRRGLVAAFALLLLPILLAGSRAAWLMYALVVFALAWRETRTPLRFLGWSAAAAGLIAFAAMIAFHDSRAFDARVEKSLRAFTGTEQAIDEASAGRVRIWGTAARMIAAHPVNGVGVRAFRYAYPQYAGKNDWFVHPEGDEGALHAHQIVLEVLSETGLIGLAFWIAAAFLALRAWRRAPAPARERALAPALALAVMTFPLNTHLAFYGTSAWGLVFWWLLALYCTVLHAQEPLDAT